MINFLILLVKKSLLKIRLKILGMVLKKLHRNTLSRITLLS